MKKLATHLRNHTFVVSMIFIAIAFFFTGLAFYFGEANLVVPAIVILLVDIARSFLPKGKIRE